MGWKLSSIIINNPHSIKYEDLLQKLGFRNFTKIEDDLYDSVMFPEKNKIFIGLYKNNLIIAADELPMSFFNEPMSSLENQLSSIFSNSEICAVSLHSAMNHFGFAVIKNGKKIRLKAGDADIGTVFDLGVPLEQELELLSKSKINKDGQREYYLDSNMPYTEDQIGENLVFEIIKRYTGKSFDADEDLMDTVFSGYQIDNNTRSTDNFFSGKWEGFYCYGEGYREITKGKKTNFTMSLNVLNGMINGTSADESKQTDDPATINGFIIDSFICFVHQYPFKYFLNDKGDTQKDISKPSSPIDYCGLYDADTDSFKGTWHIQNKKFWGDWSMKRKSITTI